MLQTTINIAIVDDHTLFRDGLANLLGEYDHIHILWEARNGVDMQEQIRRHGVPDVLLMDISMPLMDGHEATGWLKDHYPAVFVLALSMYEDDINIIKMLRKGATGYILKECNAIELVRAIQSIMETGFYINDLVSGKLARSVQEGSASTLEKDKRYQLSAREIEFLTHCCSELTYKEMAEQMFLSPRTIDGYREELFERLQVHSRTGLVLYAIKHKLIVI